MKPNALTMLAYSLAFLVPTAACGQGVPQHAPRLDWKQKASLKETRLATLFKAGDFKDTQGNRMPYRYFQPKEGDGESSKYPLVVYLHGEDEAGTDNNAQLTKTECATVWTEPAHLAQHPVYVLAPQIAKGQTWDAEPAYSNTLALLDQFAQSHPSVDRNRIYLVGFSMGATGLWKMLLKNPKLFAAAMPISGSAEEYLGDSQAWAGLKNTPVIIIHSYDDAVVPISAAIDAAAALQAGGNTFLGYGAPTPSLWSPASTPSPHDAWYTAFEKFEVIYNSLFLGDLGRTHNGEIDPTTLYTSRDMGDGITQVWDYALGTSWVIERPDKAVMIDATMGHGGLYQFVRDHVLKNKDVGIEVFLTHQHQDHILGLASFVGSPQLKKVYVHQEDSGPVKKLLGPDAGKLSLVKDGDLVPLGGKDIEVIGVPGHTPGSIIMKYENYLFSGDSIGTGYIGVGAFSVEQYIPSLQHLIDRMGSGKYTIYAGHTGELTQPMTETYVHQLMECARAVVNDSIPNFVYWRGRDSADRRVSTVGTASITYSLTNVHHLDGALRGLQISQGTLLPGYSPEFSPGQASTAGFASATSYYSAYVAAAVNTLTITPTALEIDYKSLTINGDPAKSGAAYDVVLNPGKNRFEIRVTAVSGTAHIYTLNVTRADR